VCYYYKSIVCYYKESLKFYASYSRHLTLPRIRLIILKKYNRCNCNDEDEVVRALMIQRAADLLKPMPLIPYIRAHLGAGFLKSMFLK
jgi:hypothetical protein